MGTFIAVVVILGLTFVLWRGLRTVSERFSGERDQGRAHMLGMAANVTLAVGLVLVGLLVLFSTFVVIPAGHVGVASLFGSVQPRPLYEGLNIVNPLLAVTPMSTQVQKYQEKYEAVTKDLQAVLVEMVLNYRLLPERAPEVYQKIGVNFANVIILPAAQEVLKANTALHVANEILRQRPKIKLDVQETLATWLAKYGVELKEAALANIRFDKAYEKAIEDKQIEEQRAEQKLYELTQAQRQAEIVAATAKGKGDAARAQAEGEADALRTKGEAEATYNAKVAASLTPTLIQQQYLMRWNGQLPQYMLGGDNSLLLQLPGGIQK
jgi:regulator of protease activity HflC (stomatin/prohibitin superfamily)